MRDGVDEVLAPQAGRRRRLGRVRRRPALRAGRLRRPGGLRARCASGSSSSTASAAPRGNRLFYLATPPSVYADIVDATSGAPAWRRREHAGTCVRVIIEKPFGHDLASARELNDACIARLRRAADLPHRPLPRQGDRPEPPRLPLRATASSSRSGTASTSTTCRSPWPRTIGVEGRGAYYEEAGALRDIVQNHLLQLLALVAMEPPSPSRPTPCATRR